MKRGTIDPPIAEHTSTTNVEIVWACCLLVQIAATAKPSPEAVIAAATVVKDQSSYQRDVEPASTRML